MRRGENGYLPLMRSFLSLVAVVLVGCGSAGSPDAVVIADAGTSIDAGSDAGAVSYVDVIQPLLWEKCATCHTADAGGGLPLFAISYSEMLVPSRLCPGDRVGDCVKAALDNQRVEGSGCRTSVVRPFHREGWSCLTPAEIGRVGDWVDAGMRER